ncbi:DUF6879 family protein [Nonomuraea sp. NPDC050328]|uniref:DUF6879 family protein n=1 Tax=Nonomuraea sp. NPDC050328 TaxID=3364361 RepID=UPI00378BFB4B
MPPPPVEQLLADCKESALHLELRDGYTADDPAFHAWKAGHRIDLNDRRSWWRPWLQNIVDATSRGVRVRRARIVSEPVSDYIRFEHGCTVPNVRAGEEVRWLSRRNATSLPLPANDFWLFDGQLLLVHHFSGAGDKVDTEIVDTDSVITFYRDAFEAVWQRAVPHQDYRLV